MSDNIYPLRPAPPSDDDDLEQLVTVQDVAKLLKVPVSWVYHATHWKKNHLPHYKVGRYTRFSEREVRHWLQVSRRVTSRKL
jgi:excisionase family DNA binding protein